MNQYIFTEHRYEIETQINTTVKIIPFGDVHRYAEGCAEKVWLETIQKYKSDRSCYFLGMGDYDDFASESERHALHTAKLHSTTAVSLDDCAMQRTNSFAKEIEFMRGRTIGLLEGNHHWLFQNGVTSTQKLCELLGCRYLGYMSYVTLVIKKKGETDGNQRGKYITFDLVAHHGKSGGRTAGSTFTSVDHMGQVVRSADAYLMGHDHQKGAVSYDVLYKNHQGHVRSNKIILARTGSFLKGYENNMNSYIVRNALRPANLGLIELHLTLKCRYENDEKGKQHQELYIERYCLA